MITWLAAQRWLLGAGRGTEANSRDEEPEYPGDQGG